MSPLSETHTLNIHNPAIWHIEQGGFAWVAASTGSGGLYNVGMIVVFLLLLLITTVTIMSYHHISNAAISIHLYSFCY